MLTKAAASTKAALTFLFLGVTHLYFFNVLVTTSTGVDRLVFIGWRWPFIFPTIVSSSMLFGYIVMWLLGAERVSMKIAIFWSFLVMAVATAAFTANLFLMPDGWLKFLIACMLTAAISSLAATTRGKFLGIAFAVRPNCSTFEAQGLALCGLIAVTANVLIAELLPKDSFGIRIGVTASLISAIIVFFGGALTYKSLVQLSSTVYGYDRCSSEDQPLLHDGSSVKGLTKHSAHCVVQPPYGIAKSEMSLAAAAAAGSPISHLIRLAWLDCVNCLLSLTATFVVFPGMVVGCPSSTYLSIEVFSVYINVVYQLGDNIGRLFGKWAMPRSVLFLFLLLRFAFVPIFIFANSAWRPLDWRLLLFIVFALSVSNGYGFSASVVNSVCKIPHPTDKERFGPIAGFFLQAGAVFGGLMTPLATTMAGI